MEENTKQLTKGVILNVLKEDLKEEGSNTSIVSDVVKIVGAEAGVNKRGAYELACKIKLIGDDLISKFKKEGILDDVETVEDFKNLTTNYIAIGGLLSWEGIAVYICATCKFAVKILLNEMKKLPLVGGVIGWLLESMNSSVPLIATEGGWESVLSMSTVTKEVFKTGFLTGITLGAIVTGLAILAFIKLRDH